MSSNVYIHGFGFRLGDSYSIESLSSLSNDPERLERFRDMGFEEFLYSDDSATQLGLDAISACLASTGNREKDIDAVIWCSNTFDDNLAYRNIHRGLRDLGIDNAFPIGIHGTFCGNLGTGIRIARSMINNEEVKDVLIVCTDKNSAFDEKSRLLEPSVAVTSDGASCIRLSASVGPLRVLDVHQVVNHSMADLEIDDIYEGNLQHSPVFMRYSFESFKGRKRAADEFYKKNMSQPDDYRWLISNNYGINTLKGFASEAGIPWEKLFRKNLPKTGHIQSTDNLLNLALLNEENLVDPDDKILLLSTGPYSWGYWSIERTTSPLSSAVYADNNINNNQPFSQEQ